MTLTQQKIAEIDPVWRRICDEAEEAIKEEPLIGGFVHSSVLHHSSLENALAYRISMKMSSPEMSGQMLREIADRAYREEPALAESARADIVAIFDRDPACLRFLQPLLFFKGFQAIQACLLYTSPSPRD